MKMKKNELNKIKVNSSGITLIALVTTIVVLLILAGVTIAALTGDNGLLTQAVNAKEETEIASEKEQIDLSTKEAIMKSPDLEEEYLREGLDNYFQGYSLKYFEEDDIYEIALKTGRIYEIDKKRNAIYLGNSKDLNDSIIISATPENSTTSKLIQEAEVTIKTVLSVKSSDFTLLYAWTTDDTTEPTTKEWNRATVTGTTKTRTTTLYSDGSQETGYYLWLKVTTGETTVLKKFGTYQIKNHTMLAKTTNETKAESNFLGMPIKRNQIKTINIIPTKVTTHIAGTEVDGVTYYDITESNTEETNKGKFVGSFIQDKDGYYIVTLEGDGGLVANTNTSYLFAYIGYNITDVDVEINGLEYLDTSLVTSLEWTFSRCRYIKTLKGIENWNTRKVTTLQGTFSYCQSLTELDLSLWDVTNVWCLGRDSTWNGNGTFEACSALATLDLEGWNTKSVTNMQRTFMGDSNLISLNLSNFDITNVKGFGNFITTSTSNLKITTNKLMYNWFEKNYPSYLNCIEIGESTNPKLN